MKKLIRISLTLSFIGTMHLAQAFTYSDDDILLVFHDNSDFPSTSDVEYDLGPVSQLLNLSAGTVTNIYSDDGTVSGNFGDYSSCNYLIVAADASIGGNFTGRNMWLSSISTTSGTIVSGSKFTLLQGRISGAGGSAGAISPTDNPILDAPTDNKSYSYKVCGGTPSGASAVGLFGGQLGNQSETDGTNGATLGFYQIPFVNGGNGTGVLKGTFNWDASGNVTYTAANTVVVPPLVAAHITALTRTGNTTQVFFSSTNNNNYQLLYANSLPAVWQTNAAPKISGNNGVTNFTDSTAGSARYYRIQSVH